MKKKILVVDDDEISREIISAWLLNNGYEVALAVNGKEGYEQCRSIKPDAVIMDILMPDLNGDEVAELIRNDEAIGHIPIIFVTAMVSGNEVPCNNLIGGQYMVAKPFAGEELRNILAQVI
ncbi:MAG TPA: response regulator [Smithellaceae bacterium]|nr:response regulator [Smithellaceae bacterium]